MEPSLFEKAVQQSTDTEIITAVLSGRTPLYEILIRRYNPLLYKTGRGYGFNHHDTEDLMQETLISGYINLIQFAGHASFKTWLIKIMVNHCYHKIQKHQYKKEQPAESNNALLMVPNQYNNSEMVINKELNRVIEACIRKLPHDYKTTFTLRELAGLNTAETADIMHTTTTTVKVRLNRAKALLRKEIEKFYTPEDIFDFNLIYCDRIVDTVMMNIYQRKIEVENI